MLIYSGERGFTIIELLVVVIISMILMAIAALSFKDWVTRYNVEAEIKQMYAEIQSARLRAMEKKRAHFVVFDAPARTITVVDDSSPAPYGNGTIETTDTVVKTVALTNSVTFSAGFPATLSFDAKGIANVGTATGAMCVASRVSPDFDCLTIGQSRINMGKLTAQGGCIVANCQPK
jgi:prepilin-type N-terminal cleavage/methylation domain-containing protein